MPGGDEEEQGPAHAEERAPQTLFLEDTVGVEKDGTGVIGIIARTWHDLDEQESWEDVDDAVAGAMVSTKEFTKFKGTGQPPRHYFLFAPSSPQHPPMLVHESECTLLDRALCFGDVVKRSLTSPLSGTVVAVETTVGVRHSYPEPLGTDRPEDEGYVPNVPESELCFVNEWNDDDFVIYKNCWMGVVDESVEDVTVRLENGSVVVVDNPYDIEIPISPDDDTTPAVQRATASTESNEDRASTVPTRRLAPRPKTVAPPTHLSPGQTVSTSKANLRRGRWLYGAYNASIPAVGIVVEVKTVRLGVHWLCQNMMVAGRFVAVPRPPTWIEEDDFDKLRRFKKSTGGYVDMNGNSSVHSRATCPGGELQVGDRVRFADMKAASEKYPGRFKIIPRTQMLGFDINTFVVVETRTNVRVQWQDKTETCEEARDLFPYLNIDDHDVWPGETVIMRPDENATQETSNHQPGEQPALTEDRHRLQFEGMWRAFNSVATPETPLPTPEYMRIKKVGVVQTANPADRVAKVKWFVDPSVEVAGGIMIPGSRTGQLAEKEEDASFYEIMAHQALGCRRGDFVLIAPERPAEEDPAFQAAYGNLESTVGDLNSAVSSALSNSPARDQTPDTSGPDNQLSQMVDSLRGMVDGGLLSNLSATLGNSAHPQLQAVSRMLNQFPALMTGQQGSSNSTVQRASHNGTDDAYLDEAPSWIGEVVDLGLDGLITVRLGALDQLVDVRVPIERLHIIFNDEMDLGDSEDDDEEESDEDTEGDFSDDDFDDEPEVIEERVIYEGGQRLDNGGEEDWLTDEDADPDAMDIDSDDYSAEVSPNKKDSDPMEEDENPTAEGQEENKEASKKPLDPPPLPDNVPAPEAFAISTSERTPPRFAILDSEIPTDHAFASQPPTQMTGIFARRINKEHKILSNSLPEGILVRTWESRLDLLRVMIIGPLNTPYELAPFVFDFYFPAAFPTHPPRGHFHSWTNGVGRVNPNLYEDGKICLSLLGTWHAERKNEGWTASGSSVLQLLVSLMGLVLVREPWYNEAGFNVYQGAEEAALNSKLYSEKAYILARGFVKTVLTRPVQGFEKEVLWLYLPHLEEGEEAWQPGPELLKEVVRKAKDVVRRSESGEEALGTEGVGKVSAGALVLLKRDLAILEDLLAKATEKANGG